MINSSELKLGKSPDPIAFSQPNPAKSTSFESLRDIDGHKKKALGIWALVFEISFETYSQVETQWDLYFKTFP